MHLCGLWIPPHQAEGSSAGLHWSLVGVAATAAAIIIMVVVIRITRLTGFGCKQVQGHVCIHCRHPLNTYSASSIISMGIQ